MGKKGVNVHIMHSVKGGCGKSSCALLKALELAKEKLQKTSPEEFWSQKAEVLFIDADFRGSSLQWLLFGDAKSLQESGEADTVSRIRNRLSAKSGAGTVHRIALPDNYDSNNNLSKYLSGDIITLEEIINRTFSYMTNKEKETQEPSSQGDAFTDNVNVDHEKDVCVNGYIDLVLAAADAEGRAQFFHGITNGRQQMPTLSAGIYKYRIAEFLNKVFTYGTPEGTDKGQYSEIVIDMPPSYDEYSDILLAELKNLAKDDEERRLHYYSITTEDRGHLQLTLENIEEIRKGNSCEKNFDSVNVVLNSITQDEFCDFNNKLEVKKIRAVLGENSKLFRREYDDGYHKFCRSVATKEIQYTKRFEDVTEQVDTK